MRVYLPVGQETPTAPTPAAYPAALRGGHETILVVEDEDSIRRLLQICLERYGYRVILAGTGPEALDRLAQAGGQVDLLLTDLVMPGGMGGRELARRLQSLLPQLEVIYLSGYAGEAGANDARLEVGVNFLRKPFALEAIAELVRRRLDAVAVKADAVSEGTSS